LSTEQTSPGAADLADKIEVDPALAPTLAELESGSNDTESLASFLCQVAQAPAREPPAARVGTRIGAEGRYLIEALLGRGGMGTVYAAQDTLLHRRVALKVLDQATDADQQERVLREARIAAGLEHERIARVYDVGRHEDSRFVAMELVRGTTLRQWMRARVFSASEVTHIALQVAEGLAALHSAAVIHRDLKPENVMLSETGGLKLLDFGLARQAPAEEPALQAGIDLGDSRDHQTVGVISGTPGYMAPEQCVGLPSDARADVFAFGVLMYELINGTRPFDGANAREIVTATLTQTPLFTHASWLAMPEELRAIIQRSLARERDDRFADGCALVEALSPLANARNTPFPALRVTRSIWRHKRARASLAAAALLVSASAPVYYVSQRAKRQPSRPPPLGMSWVPGGTYTVGRTNQELDRDCGKIGAGCARTAMQTETPTNEVSLETFAIDQHEVTNRELVVTLNTLAASLSVVNDDELGYPRFVRWSKELGRESEYLVDLHSDFGGIEVTPKRTYRARPGREDYPAVQVTWWAAKLHCEQAGKRLPTEDEWEAAARGSDDRTYPWGNEPPRCGQVVLPRDGSLDMVGPCVTPSLQKVGTARQDVTPLGIHDLAGNVMEWTASPFKDGVRSIPPTIETATPRVLRGGSFYDALGARTSGRNWNLPSTSAFNAGFRCAVSL
jgi:serine/threonine protein kinase